MGEKKLKKTRSKIGQQTYKKSNVTHPMKCDVINENRKERGVPQGKVGK